MSELIKRITRVAGQDFDNPECRVKNPHITARESIEIADYIVSLQQKNLALAAQIEALRKAGNQVINYGLSAAHWPSAIEISAQHHLAAHDAEVAAKAVEEFYAAMRSEFKSTSYLKSTTDFSAQYTAHLRAKAGA